MMNEQEPVGQPEQPQSEPVEAEIVEPAQESNGGLRRYWLRFKQFIKECQRVIKVLQKPSREEFTTISKVSALGITVIGLVGFILSMIQQLILQ
ncbi:MAG TPA: protein translocase SEC61 complex subunit gamma [Candidatus Nanoarchaeia archaeon]|nr:protein translocase SEC61 complex subunit gamma [Candidatus Nanoarchaeia archaeon]